MLTSSQLADVLTQNLSNPTVKTIIGMLGIDNIYFPNLRENIDQSI